MPELDNVFYWSILFAHLGNDGCRLGKYWYKFSINFLCFFFVLCMRTSLSSNMVVEGRIMGILVVLTTPFSAYLIGISYVGAPPPVSQSLQNPFYSQFGSLEPNFGGVSTSGKFSVAPINKVCTIGLGFIGF